MKNFQKGFTLIEIFVILGIVAILAAIVLIAINPERQFQQANDSERWSNVNTLVNALSQYRTDSRGQLPPSITGEEKQICKSTAIATSSCADLSLLVPTYIVAVPVDPLNMEEPNDSGYVIATTTGNLIQISAPKRQISTAPIHVER